MNKIIKKQIRHDYAEGILNAAQELIVATERPAKMLFDIEKDPREAFNLVSNPDYQKKLRELQTFVEKKMLEMRDVHFLHLWDLVQRSRGCTPFEIRPGENILFGLKN